ncbi:hypothetical protein AO727_11410 [Acinetobacter baumannii]|uniref:hypothetical protein n=1 Tax=Acinetobacter calcoaceticus/baumannii complex TaxID=909768 RepID=UPI0007184796|nr:hypothetical protein [Acinetobacter baumannii]EHU1557180.1 hypothetical protein [Acinetobacter baumannii]KRW25698.1 hypothetical protein AO727_11410 [Acinetobacter baumannii]MDC4326510.1 hypothetical protein [Acinetobacter baumannii]MDC4392391.1 hypothetical protein [Acinetobacter baumannii]MDC4545173.1 hypothetical protein [Acinetobacter baumannii]
MKYDTERYRKIYEAMSPEEIAEVNRKNDEEHKKQAEAFQAGYKIGICYLCNKPFQTISKNTPCLHWLLRQCKFKKKDFPKLYQKYGYVNIAAFIRWCANQERMLSNINDLEEEKSDKKILSYTVKWKNIEWTFDCSPNDFEGHKGTSIDYPHYHFQMRIDGQQFINFNDFHLPFHEYDLFILKISMEQGDWFRHNFGAIGSGMQEAIDVDLNDILENTTISENQDEATYHFSTFIDASNNPISGEEIYDIQKEAERTGKSFAYVAQHRLKERASVQTIISPADSIPDIASRTEHNRR